MDPLSAVTAISAVAVKHGTMQIWHSQPFQDFLYKAATRFICDGALVHYRSRAGAIRGQTDLMVLSDAEHRYLEAKNDREERALELQRLHLSLSHRQHQEGIAISLKKIQADHDIAHWSGLMSRDETQHILANAQNKHRLLLILSEPDVSASCPEMFHHDLHREARAEVKQFVEHHYPLRDELCPVEFFGKFFKSSVFDTEVKQLESLLAPVPTVVLYSDLTDEKLYLHLHAWGFPESLSDTLAWNWEESMEALLAGGLTEKQALREIRRAIVGLYQWFAALLADMYYLGVNPLHQPRLYDHEESGVPTPALGELRALQQRVRGAYEQEARLGRAPSRPQPPQPCSIHGWPAAKVQDLQRRAAESLGLSTHFHLKLKSGELAPAMTVIPAGGYMMGSPIDEPERDKDEGPQHAVAFAQPFAIGRYAVTFEDFDRFCHAARRELPDDQGWGRGWHPVINVSWADAVEYCEWLSRETGHRYRLPSEAEWEYACRAGVTTAFWWGSRISTQQANYNGEYAYDGGASGPYRGKTVPMYEFEPNPFGLHQMHGNVWEWCQDTWHQNYEYAPKDGSAWMIHGDSRRVVRGGAWNYGPVGLRSAFRYRYVPTNRLSFVGFRLAQDF